MMSLEKKTDIPVVPAAFLIKPNFSKLLNFSIPTLIASLCME
jgi:hypothetical protein